MTHNLKYHGEPKAVTDQCEGCQYHRTKLPSKLIEKFPKDHYQFSSLGWCLWGSAVMRLTILTKHQYVCRLLRQRLPWNSISKEF